MNADHLLAAARAAQTRREHRGVLQLCDRLLSVPGLTPDQRAEVHRLKCRALLFGLREPGAAAVQSALLAVASARRSQDPRLLRKCLEDAVKACIFSRHYRKARSLVRELARGREHPPLIRSCHLALGWMEFLAANYGRAAQHYLRAEAADPLDPVPRLALATVELRTGRPWRALQWLHQAQELTAPEEVRSRCLCLVTMAWAHVEMGRYHRARDLLDQVRRLADPVRDATVAVGYYLVLALAALGAHSPRAARTYGQLALDAALGAGRLDLCDLVQSILDRAADQEHWAGEDEP